MSLGFNTLNSINEQTKDMFIEELWEKDSELVKKALKIILNVNEKAGDRLDFSGIKRGVLTCAKYGEQFNEIGISDYEINIEYMNRYFKSEKLSKKCYNLSKKNYR